MKLDLEAADYSVRRTPIVADVSLTVEPGRVVGLIGPNGSGKSTVLRLMAGLLRPTAGRVLLNGEPIEAMSRRRIAQQVAVVEQQAETGDPIRVRDVVELGRTPWLSPLAPWSEHDTAVVDRALADVGMAALAERRWHTLSGGERQRVQIARALAQEPGVLLLDEPTNHLDIRQQLAILNLVAQLRVTTVIALHDLNHALQCDRLAVMKQGRLRQEGTPEELLTAPFLREVFGICAHPLIDPADGATVLRFHRFAANTHCE